MIDDRRLTRATDASNKFSTRACCRRATRSECCDHDLQRTLPCVENTQLTSTRSVLSRGYHQTTATPANLILPLFLHVARCEVEARGPRIFEPPCLMARVSGTVAVKEAIVIRTVRLQTARNPFNFAPPNFVRSRGQSQFRVRAVTAANLDHPRGGATVVLLSPLDKGARLKRVGQER
jgi:hypothetical protein